VITGDIGQALGVRASGTWRPAPADSVRGRPGSVGRKPGYRPGTYATSLPFRLAAETGQEPGEVAAELAARLGPVGWIADAVVTGGGYLTVTVTPSALARLAVRVPAAGAGCAASDALRGTCVAAPPAAGLASASSWAEAWDLVTAAVAANLAAAAGAKIKATKAPERRPAPGVASPAAAVAAAGAEAVCYTLTRTSVRPAGPVNPMRYVPNNLLNPFFAVRYAHARAASVLRWAADLGIERGQPAGLRPETLAHRSELELLGAISWLPERVAAAARRRRPDVFARCLEHLAVTWLDCSESCPALPFGGRSAPDDGPTAAARLWLAAAAQTALGTCLRLLGVEPPPRL
jgi:arginyl-tRNA synthetase